MNVPIELCDDGLIIPEVGDWTKRKLHFLSRYLQLFSTGMKTKWPTRIYIDLFASAGLCRLRQSREVVLSSAIIAATVKDAFTKMYFCEKNSERADALESRLKAIGADSRAHVIRGNVNDRIDEIIRKIPDRNALSVAFADPYGLHLDFETVEKISRKRCDLIILLADNMDALRNWAQYYMGNPDSNLDRFMGEAEWRDVLAEGSPSGNAERLRNRYIERLQSIDYTYFRTERVQNSHGADLYSLVFASRHQKGTEFWDQAARVDEGGQRELFRDS